MIDRILDNYYTKQLIKYIKDDVLLRYNIDVKTEQTKNTVSIYAKPRYYKNYTCLIQFYKNYAFIHIIDFKCDKNSRILDKIKYLDKENAWNKGIDR